MKDKKKKDSVEVRAEDSKYKTIGDFAKEASDALKDLKLLNYNKKVGELQKDGYFLTGEDYERYLNVLKDVAKKYPDLEIRIDDDADKFEISTPNGGRSMSLRGGKLEKILSEMSKVEESIKNDPFGVKGRLRGYDRITPHGGRSDYNKYQKESLSDIMNGGLDEKTFDNYFNDLVGDTRRNSPKMSDKFDGYFRFVSDVTGEIDKNKEFINDSIKGIEEYIKNLEKQSIDLREKAEKRRSDISLGRKYNRKENPIYDLSQNISQTESFRELLEKRKEDLRKLDYQKPSPKEQEVLRDMISKFDFKVWPSKYERIPAHTFLLYAILDHANFGGIDREIKKVLKENSKKKK